ncbi:transmembrane protein 230-like isoform X1 [Anarhichas minor]|uniref:transmembrane protein 230-like isoform X1 n=1 Tax=Anarhichas minor TaxID=65739 RepID=UPI003F736B68
MKEPRGNMLGVGISNNKVKYSRLAADDDGYIDLQFKKSPPTVPYKAIALAIFLFLIGSLLIIFGALLLSGIIKVEGTRSQTDEVITSARLLRTASSFRACLSRAGRRRGDKNVKARCGASFLPFVTNTRTAPFQSSS